MNTHQVIVCGGGPSGITAALAAARNGAHTLLIEQFGFAGGASTNALVYPWMSFHDLRGNQVVAGIAQEIVSALQERGGSPGHVRDTIGFVRTITPFDPEIYKCLLDEMLSDAGVETFYHSRLAGVEVGTGRIQAIRVLSPSGISEFSADIYIDATGDGDLAAMAGNPFVMGRKIDGLTQPMTMNFVLGGVDLEEVKAYIIAHPQEFHSDTPFNELDQLPLTGVSGFLSIGQRTVRNPYPGTAFSFSPEFIPAKSPSTQPGLSAGTGQSHPISPPRKRKDAARSRC